MRRALILLFALLICGAASATAGESAIVTSLDGGVYRVSGGTRQALQTLAKLSPGDFLALEGSARLHIVYYASRRLEIWQGSGRIEIAKNEGHGLGLPEPQVRLLPSHVVRQIARTPSVDSEGRVELARVRAIATPDALVKLDNDYKRLRMEAGRDDLEPEMFLLSGLLEMRQVERVREVLTDLRTSRPYDMQVKLLAALYDKSLRNLRVSTE